MCHSWNSRSLFFGIFCSEHHLFTMMAAFRTLKLLLFLLPLLSNAFVVTSHQRGSTRICYSKKDKENDDSMMLDELSWRAAKIRLEDAHTQGFLKRKPVKLRYLDARRWVQANLGADTKEEFRDMVANGNLRTPYIPKNPKAWYTETGDWISWDHFLTGFFDEQEPGIAPCTGKFD